MWKSISAIVLLVAVTLAPAVRAELFCVDTENELIGSLHLSVINGQQNEIRVVSGMYVIPDGWSIPDTTPLQQALKLSGGWNSDCSTRATVNPDATTIHGQSNSNARWIISARASVIIESLHFLENAGVVLGTPYDCTPFGQEFIVRRVRISNSISGIGSWPSLRVDTSCHLARITNNLIVGGALNGIEIDCFLDAVGSYRLINNTVRNHSGFDLQTQYESANCSANELGVDTLYNNIFGSIHLTRNTPRAYNNIYQTLTTSDGGGFFAGSADNLVVDPELDPIDYRPNEPNSPAINSGTDSVPGGLPATDITGATRVIGGTVDRGAFESSVVPPGPFVLTVTSSASSGSGTLRDILNQANANPGLNLVQFDIPGSCPRFITLAEPLPDITESVIINGYSQSGASFNNFEHGNNGVLCIGLIASQLVDVPFALRVPSNSSAKLTVRGIGFGGYDDGGGLLGEAAIFMQGGSGHQIQGNQFGGAFHGTTLAVSSENIRLMNSASNALIGGSSPGNRNTLSGSSLAAIQVIGTASHDHQIINNYIGTNPAGIEAVGNFDGIRLVHSEDNLVLDNLISGQTRDGIVLAGEGSTGNLIAGNRIGGRRGGILLCGISPLPPCPPIPTNRKGILIDSDASNNSIGVAGPKGRPNLIRYSTEHAIRIMSGQRNRILSNSLSLNGSVASEIEIDLGSFGLDANDNDCAASADLLANRGQNRPVLATASIDGDAITIEGLLSSCSNDGGFSSVYRLQFFASSICDPGGNGPAQDFLGDYNVIVSAPDNTPATVAFEAVLPIPEFINVTGRQITATATDLFGNTSELSFCVPAITDGLFADRFEQ